MKIYTNSFFFPKKRTRSIEFRIIELKFLKEDIGEEIDVGQLSTCIK